MSSCRIFLLSEGALKVLSNNKLLCQRGKLLSILKEKERGYMFMLKEMNRRDFLKATAVTGTVLLTGDIFRSRAFAQGSVKIPEAEKIVITVITDNYADSLRPDYKIAKRWVRTSNRGLHGEHGLAYHVETTVDGRTHSFLFDFASDAHGIKNNIKLLPA